VSQRPWRKKEKKMSRIRGLMMGMLLLFALAVLGQQPSNGPEIHHMPSVEDHVKLLSEKLNLTANQQVKVTPVIREMQDTMEKTNQDASLSQDERHSRMRDAHMKADKQMRTFLTEPQKTKLTEMEQEAHMDVQESPAHP
jgi:Spy/CpxP family protein refolding chaperone